MCSETPAAYTYGYLSVDTAFLSLWFLSWFTW